MRQVYTSCAGLDVHKRTVVACRWRVVNQAQVEREVKTFGTTSGELLALGDWLGAWAVSHVAMESTGDYWKPVYNLLEGSLTVVVANAQHVKHVPGRKTDVKDAEWLAELLCHGLLKPSFVPPRPQRVLRDMTRYRTNLVEERARLVNRVQKLLEAANIKLASVASDVLGVSGRRMLEAIVVGHASPQAMAELAKGRLRSKLPQLEQALTGRVEAHHRWLLAHQLAHIDFLDEQIDELSGEISRYLTELSQTPPSTPPAQSPPPQAESDTPSASLTWQADAGVVGHGAWH